MPDSDSSSKHVMIGYVMWFVCLHAFLCVSIYKADKQKRRFYVFFYMAVLCGLCKFMGVLHTSYVMWLLYSSHGLV